MAAVERERQRLALRVQRAMEVPMLVLAVAWLALTGIELAYGLAEPWVLVQQVVWVIFVLEFGARFIIAPRKLHFLSDNWLTAISLALPALRVFRIARLARAMRAARAARGLRLAKVLGSVNRGMKALSRSLRRRGFGYVAACTVLVTFLGAAAALAFERGNEGFETYADALWWTAMMMTTLGSAAWPRTPEGRLLAVALAVYAFTVFGYITAVLASYFVDRDAEAGDSPTARELRAIRGELAALRAALAPDPDPPTAPTGPANPTAPSGGDPRPS